MPTHFHHGPAPAAPTTAISLAPLCPPTALHCPNCSSEFLSLTFDTQHNAELCPLCTVTFRQRERAERRSKELTLFPRLLEETGEKEDGCAGGKEDGGKGLGGRLRRMLSFSGGWGFGGLVGAFAGVGGGAAARRTGSKRGSVGSSGSSVEGARGGMRAVGSLESLVIV